MNKLKMAKETVKYTTIAFAIGLILILSSGAIGQYMGDSAIQSNGGSMDTSQYERIIDGNATNFRTVGMALALVGGLGVLMGIYGVYSNLEQ